MTNVVLIGSAATAVFVVGALIVMANLLKEISDLQMEVQVSMDEYKVCVLCLYQISVSERCITRVSLRTLGIAF